MALNGEAKPLYLICDTSGSMLENGKNTLMRGVARTVEQFVRLGYGVAEIKLVFWNSTAELVEWYSDDEFPEQMLDCRGSSNAAALRELLDGVQEGLYLLLTDGWWSRTDLLAMKSWKLALPPGSFRIIIIGSDANPLLKNDVFLPDDVISVLQGWLPPGAAPAKNGDEDEW